MSDLSQIFSGFSKLSRSERLERLVAAKVLLPEDILFLQHGGDVDLSVAEHFIENVIGFFHLPMGVAANLNIDGEDIVVPMAVEETSIIAAVSKTAKWIREHGSIRTELLGREIIGQIQIGQCQDAEICSSIILKSKKQLIEAANKIVEGIVRRGGGFTDLKVRILDRPDQTDIKMVVVHLYCDPCDAMGANLINQACEGLKPLIQDLTGEKVTMCILSNLVDSRLTKVQIDLKGLDSEIAEGIAEASLFAKLDPYRAATNNKGVMNGMDAVLIATGNDWRAVEAGVHAYAAKDGQYRSISDWIYDGETLTGTLIAPIIVGTVGGVTTLHPTAKLALRMMNIQSSEHLSRIVGAVGLVQNLGALRALSTVGVVEGHMKLHATNLAMMAGASQTEMGFVQRRLELILKKDKRVSLKQAIEVLKDIRNDHSSSIQNISLR